MRSFASETIYAIQWGMGFWLGFKSSVFKRWWMRWGVLIGYMIGTWYLIQWEKHIL